MRKRIKNVPLICKEDRSSLLTSGCISILHSGYQQTRNRIMNLRLAFDLSISTNIEQTI